MKKNLLYLSVAALFLITCQKESEPVPEESAHRITISNITTGNFNSAWQHVLGGTAVIKFTPLNNSASGNPIVDSFNLADAINFSKKIVSGTYNIYLDTKPAKNAADTFIRFSAVKENYVINADGELVFQGTTKDGLITINKEFVNENTIPAFVPTGSSATFKLGLTKGAYYLYADEGTTGTLTFYEKTTGQAFSKSIAVSSKNQYNLVVISNTTKSVSVEFAEFAYNEIPVNAYCPYYNNPQALTYKWFNAYTEKKHYDNSGNLLATSLEYPVGYFQINANKTYNVMSNNVPLNGNWEMRAEDCHLVLDRNTSLERAFKILKASTDSLVISRKDGLLTYIQHYYK